MELVLLGLFLLFFCINPERTLGVLGGILGLGGLLFMVVPAIVGFCMLAALGAVTIVEAVHVLIS